MDKTGFEAKRILEGMAEALKLFYQSEPITVNDAVRAENARIGLQGYAMALVDQKKAMVDEAEGKITLKGVPLEVLTLLPLVFGKGTMTWRPYSVYEDGQLIGTVEYTEPVVYWDKKHVEIWAITRLTTRFKPIERTREISFGFENEGPSEIVLGPLGAQEEGGGRAGKGE